MKWPSPAAVLCAVATATLALIGFDAERVISGLDDVRRDVATANTQIAVIRSQLDNVQPRIGVLEGEAVDHEGRLRVIENTPAVRESHETQQLNRNERHGHRQ